LSDAYLLRWRCLAEKKNPATKKQTATTAAIMACRESCLRIANAASKSHRIARHSQMIEARMG